MDHEQVNADAFEEDPVDPLVHNFFTAFSSSLCRRQRNLKKLVMGRVYCVETWSL